MSNFQPVDIAMFQEGREAAMAGQKRDLRRHRDWLDGYDQVKPIKEASYVRSCD
jgi:hypothetical protein